MITVNFLGITALFPSLCCGVQEAKTAYRNIRFSVDTLQYNTSPCQESWSKQKLPILAESLHSCLYEYIYSTNVNALPVLPPRPVRPMRCT